MARTHRVTPGTELARLVAHGTLHHQHGLLTVE